MDFDPGKISFQAKQPVGEAPVVAERPAADAAIEFVASVLGNRHDGGCADGNAVSCYFEPQP